MTKRLALLTLLSCLLAACGNKGPLVLPERPAAAPVADAPAEAPVEAPAAPAVPPPANGDAGTPVTQP